MRDRSENISSDHKRSSGGPVQKYNVVSLKKLERLGIDLYKIQDGDNYVRILPPDDDELMFGRRVYLHYGIGPNQTNVLCPNRTHDANNEQMGKHCPICELASSFWNKEDEASKERAKDLFASERWLFWVIDTTDEKSEEKGAMLFDSPKKIKEELTGLCIGRRGAATIDPSHPEKGRDLFFNKQGKGKTGTSYSSFKLLDGGEPIPEDWYSDLPKFDDVLHWIDAEELEAMIDGLAEAPLKKEEKKDEPKKEGDLPARSSRRRSRRPAAETDQPAKEDFPVVNEDAEPETDDIPFHADSMPSKEKVEEVPTDTPDPDPKKPEEPDPKKSEEADADTKAALQDKLDAFKKNRASR